MQAIREKTTFRKSLPFPLQDIISACTLRITKMLNGYNFTFADKKEDQIQVCDRWCRILPEPTFGRTNGSSR